LAGSAADLCISRSSAGKYGAKIQPPIDTFGELAET
jgi:hypothetical protein